MSHWNKHHEAYLKAHVRGGWRGEEFDLASASAPETFRTRTNVDEYGHTGDEIDLVRVERLRRIATAVGEAPEDFRDLAADVAAERLSTGAAESARAADLDQLLRQWQEAGDMDNRPIFACFWENAATVLEDPQPNWANDLRDRLGLLHYDPPQRLRRRGIDVVAFRYPVELVPRTDRSGLRPIARPTVLDGPLSRSFCTFPAGSGRGCALDLAGRAEEPWQEVVHPAVTFAARHVWAVGVIDEPASVALELPRWAHYEHVRGRCDDDFAVLVDSIEAEPT